MLNNGSLKKNPYQIYLLRLWLIFFPPCQIVCQTRLQLPYMISVVTMEDVTEYFKDFLYNAVGSGFSPPSMCTPDPTQDNTKLPLPDYVQSFSSRMFSFIKWSLIASALLICAGTAMICWPVTLALWLWYETVCVQPVRLYYQQNARNHSLIKHCPILQKTHVFILYRKWHPHRYRPTPYISMIPFLSGHVQTLLHEFIRHVPDLEFDRFVISLWNWWVNVYWLV